MKKSLLLTSLLCTGATMFAVAPKTVVASPEATQMVKVQAADKKADAVVAKDAKIRANAPVAGVLSNYNVPAGMFFKGTDETLSGYKYNMAVGGAYKPVTWTNASVNAVEYSWAYTNPEFPEDESLQTIYSTEENLTVTYPYSSIASPVLEAFGEDGSEDVIDPYTLATVNNEIGNLPVFYFFGGYDENGVGLMTYPRKGVTTPGFTSFIQMGYMKNPGQYANYFGENGTALRWTEIFEDSEVGTDPQMTGFANLFPKPQSAYLTTRAWLWLSIDAGDVVSATPLTVTLYKVTDEGEITDEVIASGTTTVMPQDEDYDPIGFDLKVLDEDGFETEEPVLINSAVMMVVTGFAAENSGIKNVIPVAGNGMIWSRNDYESNPFVDVTHAYSYITYKDNDGVEKSGFFKSPLNYIESEAEKKYIAVTDYIFQMDYIFGACEEANNDYTFNAPYNGGDKTFDFNVIFYISPEDIVVSEGADWIQTSIVDANTNGVGSQVKVTVAANETGAARTATVTVSAPAAEPKVITVGQGTSGIEIIENGVETVASEYYDLQGRKLYGEPVNGLFIRKDVKADGSVKAVKVVK